MDILKGNSGKYFYFSVMSILAASGNMGVIYLINRIINNLLSATLVSPYRYLPYLVLAMLVFFVSRWLVSFGILQFTQMLLCKTRLEVLQMILRSSYHSLLRNKDRIYTAMTRDTDNVVNASINLVDIMTNTLIVTICFIYMGILSWKLLVCMLGLLLFTLTVYVYSQKKAQKLFKAALESNDIFLRYLGEILSGFKEIIMEKKKGTDIVERHLMKAVGRSADLNQRAFVIFLNNRVIGQVAFYTFIGVLVLFLGHALSIGKEVLINFIFLLLYVWGPIETVVLLIPALSQAKTSLERLSLLDSQADEKSLGEDTSTRRLSFSGLQLKNIRYQYEKEEGTAGKENDHSGKEEADGSGFAIGPLNFHLAPAEIVFISGGNGSGKSTFINILVGLFNSTEGEIFINDERVENKVWKQYRSLFAPVFSDCHLFDEFYGVENIDVAKVNEYLKLFELDRKVGFEGRSFSTTNLSTGQRKRLALIYGLLERKPIIVLDEFAADQDPQFRRKFYHEILEYLKSEGFTVVAVTHDDHYYGCCDRIYHMNEGKLEAINHSLIIN